MYEFMCVLWCTFKIRVRMLEICNVYKTEHLVQLFHEIISSECYSVVGSFQFHEIRIKNCKFDINNQTSFKAIF